MTESDSPSDLELQILSVLWEDEPVPVREVLEKLPDGKSRAYTTILSSLQVMEKKGLVKRARSGRTDQWSSAVKRDNILGLQVDRLVSHGFSGRASGLTQCSLDRAVDGDDLAEIQTMLDARREQKGGE